MKPIIFLAISCLTAAGLRAEEITVFAAASLMDALTVIGKDFEKTTGDKARFNFAASNTLARQIEAGAPADVFFSADETQMDLLDGRGLIAKETRIPLLGNTLVVVTAADGPVITRLADLNQASIRRLSIANPAATPAGVYARKHLEKSGLWNMLAPRIAAAENVRAALAVVESGNAEAGIVYKTDAAVSTKVRIAMEIPAADGPPIIYPVAVTADSRHAATARKFLAYLTTKQTGEAFTKRGFILLTPCPKKPSE